MVTVELTPGRSVMEDFLGVSDRTINVAHRTAGLPQQLYAGMFFGLCLCWFILVIIGVDMQSI